MKREEIEEIRKYWINPETKRAWDIFASSSEALYTAKLHIPTLLSALEAAQEENKGLMRVVEAAKRRCKAAEIYRDESLGDSNSDAYNDPDPRYQLLVAADDELIAAVEALARTEKEGGG